MENNMIKASNETMAADNRSAVEIWRDFVKSIEFEMKASKNTDEFMIYASRFESAADQGCCFRKASSAGSDIRRS